MYASSARDQPGSRLGAGAIASMVGAVSSGSAPILYIAGDVHLHGADDGNPFPDFLDELARRSPARLVILGDLFEYWLEAERVVAFHEHVLGRLRALKASGWRLDLVCGNREFAAGRRLAIASGCTLNWPRLPFWQLGRRSGYF